MLKEADPERHERLVAHLRNLWKGDDCSIMICERCGFGFASPFVAGDAAFYELAYPHVGYASNRWEFDRTIRELSALDTRGMQGLEIGAGFGMFLDKLALPKTALSAIEYHPDSRAELIRKGYHAYPIDVRSPEFVRKDFDLVFIFQAVEHMDRLDDLMDKLYAISTDVVHLFISVPSIERTNYFEEHGWQFDMPPAHVSRWTVRAMEALASRHGFAIRAQDRQPFAWKQFPIDDLPSVYLRQAQIPGTIAHRIRRLPRSTVRQWLQIAAILSYAPKRAGEWLKITRYKGNLGGALWFHLVKSTAATRQPVDAFSTAS